MTICENFQFRQLIYQVGTNFKLTYHDALKTHLVAWKGLETFMVIVRLGTAQKA